MKKLFGAKWDELNTYLKKVEDGSATKAEVAALTDLVKANGQAMAEAVEAIKQPVDTSFDAKFEEFLVSNKEKLAEIARTKQGSIEFVMEKVVGDMSTASGGDVATPPVNFNTQLSRISFRNDNSLISACNIVNTNSASLAYTETIPKDGGYAFVAEGDAKPQQDFTWEVRYTNPYKVAAYQIFSEEVVTDIPRIMSVAKGQLKETHDLFKVNNVYFAAGTGILPTGAAVVGRVFAAGTMALGVANPTMVDIINACVTDIYTTPNYTDEAPFMPNMVLLNPVDFFLEMKAAKDVNGNPLYPGVTLFSAVTKDGMTIAPWHKVPSGKIFVGDMRKMNLSNYVRYSVRIGWINDQLITNEFTVVAESRYHQYVRNLDQAAFIYDDFATIRTALTAV